MHGSVVSTTQQDQVIEFGGTAVGPSAVCDARRTSGAAARNPGTDSAGPG